MCTIVKVKRKITDDPVDCLIIECKKKKLLTNDTAESTNSRDADESIKQILKYIGSASNEVRLTFLKRQIY